VLCSTSLRSTGKAEWNYQFQNTYSKKVYLVYQDEAVSSTGAPPTFSAPSGKNLGPGEKSAAYTDYLNGTCDSRRQIFIRVVSISDTQGNQMQAKPRTSKATGFAGTPHTGSNLGANAGNSETPGTKAATSSNILPGDNAALPSTGPASTPGLKAVADPNSVVGTWACKVESSILGGATGQASDSPVVDPPRTVAYTFKSDGTYDPGGYSWSQNGTGLVIHFFRENGRPGNGQLLDSSHLVWTVESLYGPAPFPKQVMSFNCNR